MDDGKPRDIAIRQGELFLLPAGVPHSPQRGAGTIGLVVEVPKFARGTHHLRWYCRQCNSVVHDAAFEPVDLGKQIKAMIEEFKGSTALRTCKKCSAVFAV
jgi:3-hydroxyanthranilate 3,4-dioxygenase